MQSTKGRKLTTFVSASSNQRVTHEADVVAIRDIVHGAGADGLPLNELFDRLVAEGRSLPNLSAGVMQLVRERRMELTPERRLRWTETVQ
jgi:hypothetical protein